MTPDSNNSQTPPPYRARLGTSLKLGTRLVWDRLGLVLAMSMTGTVALIALLGFWRVLPKLMPPLTGNLLGLGFLIAVLAPLYGGMNYVAHLVNTHEEVTFTDLWRGAAKFGFLALRLGFLQSLAAAIFLVNLWFYLQIRAVWGGVALVLCCATLLYWGMMALYQYPLLIAQELGLFDDPDRRAKRGVIAVVRRSFFLAFGNPLFSFAHFLCFSLITLLFFATAAPFVALWWGGAAIVTTTFTRALLAQYEVVPPPPTTLPLADEGFRLLFSKPDVDKKG